MKLKIIDGEFSVCRLTSLDGVDFSQKFIFLSITDDEISYVCPSAFVPEGAEKVESGWKAMKIEGVLDFALVGILSEITGLLAKHQISVFAVSTYNTDYILVKAVSFQETRAVLCGGGYEIG